MRAMLLTAPPAPGTPGALVGADVTVPRPRDDEILVRVALCGVCRTDLDLVDGRLPAAHYPMVPGHQIVGRVAATGSGVADFVVGERVGIAWINSACGSCHWCVGGRENLCPDFRGTGCDADGGYAEYAVVRARFAHRIPDPLADAAAAPLLCAGAVGLRALRATELRPGDPLGLTGFGASAHIVLQLARIKLPGSPLFVFARSEGERAFALQLGADWAGDTADRPPAPMGAVIDTTPAWRPVVAALPHLLPGGTLVVNAIRKLDTDRDELTRIAYHSHLWMERGVRSVANVTRADVRETLELAVAHGLLPTVEELPLAAAEDALRRLRSGSALRGALVLRVSTD